MIVEILVAGGQCIDTLGEQCLQSMLDTPRITPIGNDFGQAAGQAMLRSTSRSSNKPASEVM